MEVTKIHKIILNKEDLNNAIYNYLLEKKVIDNNISLEQNKYYYIDKSIVKDIKKDEQSDVDEDFEGHIFLGDLREEIEEFPLKIAFRIHIKWEDLDVFENRKGPFIESEILESLLNNEISQEEFIESTKKFHLNKIVYEDLNFLDR